MTGKLHMSLGIYAGAIGGLFLIPGLPSKVIFMTGSIFGSLVPDIDIPTSTIGKRIPFIPKLINSCFGHRGITHSPFCVLLLFFVFHRMNFRIWIQPFLTGILIGYVMYLIQDFFTKGGIPLFFPFIRKKYSVGLFKSGSKFDSLITKAISIIWTIFLISFQCYGNLCW